MPGASQFCRDFVQQTVPLSQPALQTESPHCHSQSLCLLTWNRLQSEAFLQQPLDDRGDGLDSLLLLSCYLPIPGLASTTKF